VLAVERFDLGLQLGDLVGQTLGRDLLHDGLAFGLNLADYQVDADILEEGTEIVELVERLRGTPVHMSAIFHGGASALTQDVIDDSLCPVRGHDLAAQVLIDIIDLVADLMRTGDPGTAAIL